MEKQENINQENQAVQTQANNQINTQVQGLSDEEKMLFKIYASEGQGPKMNIPLIKVNDDEDRGEVGAFFSTFSEPDGAGAMQKKMLFHSNAVDLVIMRTRFKFGQFDQDAGEHGMEVYGTPELDGRDGTVDLWNNLDKKVIFTGPYKTFKKFIQDNFPDPALEQKGFVGSSIKYTEILYVELGGKIHRIYLSNTARANYWEYKEQIQGVPTFAYQTRIKAVRQKNKAGKSYYTIQFEKVGETELKKYIHLRRQLDDDLKIFDEVRENVKGNIDKDTIKGSNPEKAIIEKWNLEFPEKFKKPNCPNCNTPMVLRDSFKGPFFGCADFPNCKGITKVEDALQANTEALPTINLEDEEKPTPTEQATAPAPEQIGSDKGEIDVKDIPF